LRRAIAGRFSFTQRVAETISLDRMSKLRIEILLFSAATLLFSCSKSDPQFPGYKVATGDAAAFIINSAVSCGARSRLTNNAPRLDAEWRYKADQDGVQIFLLGGDRFAQVKTLLSGAFGPPAIAAQTNQDKHISMVSYAAPAVGAAIQLLREQNPKGGFYTQIVIVRAGAF